MKLWGGRFTKPTAPELEQLGSSIEFDRRLGSEDVRVNRVYARELHAVGILDAEELEAIQRGLDVVEQKLQEQPLLLDEDIHTAVERLLGEVLGEGSPTAAKLPTGRSRNDLAVTEFRAYLASAITALSEKIGTLQSTLVAKARTHKRTLLPGYTHMRRGQPVVFAQYLLAYFWSFERDKARLAAARERCRELAMGAGALAGNPFGIDRLRMAEELGLERVMPNSIDAVSSRDHILEFLSAAAILGTHFSRMSEDLILWSSAEFGFVSFDDAYATGSSIMPQKQNPDGCELTRGKTGRLIGDLVSLLTTVKGIATGYQRDLQEDKEPAFDALDTLDLLLPVMEGTIRTLTVHEDKMAEALSSDLLATDLAEYLVRKGVAFRSAHGIVGQVLAFAAEKGIGPESLPLDDLRNFSDIFDEDVATAWDFRASVERRDIEGGVSLRAIEEQLERAERAMSPDG